MPYDSVAFHPLTGLFSAYHAIPAEFKMVFLGNGEWTFPLQQEVGNWEQPLSIQEKMYKHPKAAYPMRSRIHGCGLIINNKNFTCGLKVGGVSFVTLV